jgi:DNA-directed RNA polymerase specialized sigma subunit
MLCERAEKYVSQDEVKMDMDVILTDQIDDFPSKHIEKQSTCEAILKNYFIDRMTLIEIAKIHHISKQYASRLVRKYKIIIAQNIRKSVDL